MKNLFSSVAKIAATTFSLSCVMLTSACASTATSRPYEESFSRITALMSQLLGDQAVPNGVNDWACKPKPGRTHVLLIHGTFSSAWMSFGALAPRLANEGFCVYAKDFGARNDTDWFKATQSVEKSTTEVEAFALEVLERTNAEQIDLIGHSQGGLIGFYLLKNSSLQGKVHHFLALAPSVRGTEWVGSPSKEYGGYCLACADQHPDSPVVQALNKDRVTVEGVAYTVLATLNDYVVVPVENQLVREPDVRNLYVQDRLPGKFATHSNMLYDDECLDLMVELMLTPPNKAATLEKTGPGASLD